MFSYEEMKDTLKKYSLDDLASDYNTRNSLNLKENDLINKQVLEDFGESTNVIGQVNNSYYRSELINALIRINNFGSNEEKDKMYSLLKKYNYQLSNELFWIFHFLNYYISESFDNNNLTHHLKGFLIYKGINILTSDSFHLKTVYGDININGAVSSKQYEKEKRKNACHKYTGLALRTWDYKKHPNIYGAYFSIPLNFKGTFDHSVVVDIDNDVCFDLAKNVILPYSFYQKVFGKPNFIISQKDFNLYDQMLQQDFGCYLTMDTLEEIRRIRSNGKI